MGFGLNFDSKSQVRDFIFMETHFWCMTLIQGQINTESWGNKLNFEVWKGSDISWIFWMSSSWWEKNNTIAVTVYPGPGGVSPAYGMSLICCILTFLGAQRLLLFILFSWNYSSRGRRGGHCFPVTHGEVNACSLIKIFPLRLFWNWSVPVHVLWKPLFTLRELLEDSCGRLLPRTPVTRAADTNTRWGPQRPGFSWDSAEGHSTRGSAT